MEVEERWKGGGALRSVLGEVEVFRGLREEWSGEKMWKVEAYLGCLEGSEHKKIRE